jgi:Flp pilus assembly pilin Flp
MQVICSESGSSSVQYASLLALIVVVCLGGVQAFGTAVQRYFQQSEESFSSMHDNGDEETVTATARGRRIGQNVPQMSLEERLRVAEQKRAQRLAELRERAASRQR